MINKKILIVDDEEEVLSLLYKRLSAEGYQVIKAMTWQDAIERTKTYMPNLILMDIVLPDLEGSEVVQMLKEDPKTEDIPVVFLSGILTRDDRQTKLEVNVGGRLFDAISKPFNYEELMSAVKRQLGSR